MADASICPDLHRRLGASAHAPRPALRGGCLHVGLSRPVLRFPLGRAVCRPLPRPEDRPAVLARLPLGGDLSGVRLVPPDAARTGAERLLRPRVDRHQHARPPRGGRRPAALRKHDVCGPRLALAGGEAAMHGAVLTARSAHAGDPRADDARALPERHVGARTRARQGGLRVGGGGDHAAAPRGDSRGGPGLGSRGGGVLVGSSREAPLARRLGGGAGGGGGRDG
mmetsp:Transcript_21369/g.69745  ORF Transcript_21369/g.69745 Transcript_21369/m.69745 type:complete len:225 (+) Transcript_21369:148-822(+)